MDSTFSRAAARTPEGGGRFVVQPGAGLVRCCSHAGSELEAVSWTSRPSPHFDASVQAVMLGDLALLTLVMTVQAVPGFAPIVEVRVDGRPQARLDMRWLSAEDVGRLYRGEHILQLAFADGRIHRLELSFVPPEGTGAESGQGAHLGYRGDRASLSHEILFYATRFRSEHGRP